jgi:hypothetical protein
MGTCSGIPLVRRRPLVLVFCMFSVLSTSVESAFRSPTHSRSHLPLKLKHQMPENTRQGHLSSVSLLVLPAESPRTNELEWASHARTTLANDGSGSFLSKTLLPVCLFLLQSFLVALLILSWENYTCSNTLPSRHTTSLKKDSWGANTVRGLAFGKAQRLSLADPDELVYIVPSYNEVMLQHRQERVPRWRTIADQATVAQSYHTLLECLTVVQNLQESVSDYQWDTVRIALRSAPLLQLEPAASALRATVDRDAIRAGGDAVVGFDWGSCAWRHCGALADAQEALDELEFMLGVLEPFEAVFCLDVVERSLRDILTVVPWDQVNPKDVQLWKKWPAYKPRISQNSSDEVGLDRIDEEYFRTLKEFRIE